jgi:transposase
MAPGRESVVRACLLIGAPGIRPTKEVRTFRTMTRELQALRDWLKAAGVTHVGMESTGAYWRPVYAELEGHFELVVGNARHIRNVPGRKTDVKAIKTGSRSTSWCSAAAMLLQAAAEGSAVCAAGPRRRQTRQLRRGEARVDARRRTPQEPLLE